MHRSSDTIGAIATALAKASYAGIWVTEPIRRRGFRSV